ncbi:hypothetical protein IFR05_010938 [Cadophora sp. M221]|nr:hypothetical protein IFR05_010938 [Cadophora sp. M221]
MFTEDNKGWTSCDMLFASHLNSRTIGKSNYNRSDERVTTSGRVFHFDGTDILLFIIDKAVERYHSKVPEQLKSIASKLLAEYLGDGVHQDQAVWKKLLSLIPRFSTDKTTAHHLPIFQACVLKCDMEIFDSIVEKTPDLSLTDLKGWTPLHLAAKNPDLMKVKSLVRQDPRILNFISRNSYRTTPLLSIDLTHMSGKEIALYLIEVGANTGATATKGTSLVMRACMAGATGVLRRCNVSSSEACKITTRHRNWLDATPIQAAVLGGFTQKTAESISYLIDDLKFDVNCQTELERTTPLHMASCLGPVTTCQYLIEKGANVNKQSVAGETPLQMALQSQNVSVVRLVLGNGAQISNDPELDVRIEVMTWGNVELRTLVSQSRTASPNTNGGKSHRSAILSANMKTS